MLCAGSPPFFLNTCNLKSKLTILLKSAIAVLSALASPMVYSFQPTSIEGGINVIQQYANQAVLKANTTVSADLTLLQPTQNGEFTLHIEASSTPSKNGISTLIQDSNADAGSSLNNKEQGRIQVSELNYRHEINSHLNITLGLVDATSFLDGSEIMNDENHNFISASLVNNPVIDFPDYVLGSAIDWQITQEISTRLFVSSTHGIADNNSRNYASLFEMNEDNKGLFSAIEFQYKSDNFFINTGAWLHNGKHEALDNNQNLIQKNDLSNYGGYLTSGYLYKDHQLEARFGIANAEVSSAAQFFSIAYQLNTVNGNIGIGYTETLFSKRLPIAQQPAQTVETYWNVPINQNWHITPSLQWFKHPVYDAENIQIDSSVFTANVRLRYEF